MQRGRGYDETGPPCKVSDLPALNWPKLQASPPPASRHPCVVVCCLSVHLEAEQPGGTAVVLVSKTQDHCCWGAASSLHRVASGRMAFPIHARSLAGEGVLVRGRVDNMKNVALGVGHQVATPSVRLGWCEHCVSGIYRGQGKERGTNRTLSKRNLDTAKMGKESFPQCRLNHKLTPLFHQCWPYQTRYRLKDTCRSAFNHYCSSQYRVVH